MSHDRGEDFETGEPPFGERHLRPYYAESMNALAERGTPEGRALGDPAGRGCLAGALNPRDLARFDCGPISNFRAYDIELIEHTWSQLPSWDRLARVTNRNLRRRPRSES